MPDFKQLIYKWFSINKRLLPWRETNDPYKIWLSEIILQQTRVVQGINYYHQFTEEFPTISDLANASEDRVLKLWQGLGYYSRARNLHATAKYIVDNFRGQFPADYKSILKLKGIGPYTAAAISSIAFNLPYPAVDGNVYRLLSRYYGITTPVDSEKGKKKIYTIAETLVSKKNPGFHNQAFMEFGALQCIPKKPSCNLCPLIETCYAALNQLQNELPVKSKKAKQRIRYFYYLLIENNETVYLEKRTGNDIWKNLYQFPLIEVNKKLSDKKLLELKPKYFNNKQANLKTISSTKKHILSHQIIYARLLCFEINNGKLLNEQFIRTNKKDIYKFAVPKLIEEFIDEYIFTENDSGKTNL